MRTKILMDLERTLRWIPLWVVEAGCCFISMGIQSSRCIQQKELPKGVRLVGQKVINSLIIDMKSEIQIQIWKSKNQKPSSAMVDLAKIK